MAEARARAAGGVISTGGLEALSAAIAAGEGLPAATRAASEALGAPVALIDRSSAVLAIAGATSDEEKELLSISDAVHVAELRIADNVVGELRYRSRGAVDEVAVRLVATILAQEVERSRAPEWASDEAASGFVTAALDRTVTDRGDILARASEVGADLAKGLGVVVVRCSPRSAQDGEWKGRVLAVAARAVRSACSGAVAGLREDEGRHDGGIAEIAAICPADSEEAIRRAAGGVERELGASISGLSVTIGHSRHAADAADIHRAGKEALLAANVGEAEDRSPLAFEDTGAYRLLLGAMTDDPGELERFYEETVAPLVAYDEQYETDLLLTVDTYLECDGAVTPTAERLYTHRHTVRYRLERIKELTGHDLTSTDGRERISLGLKSMRVLGISSPRGPAAESRG